MLLRTGERKWTDTYLKKSDKWAIATWKYAHHHLSGKYKERLMLKYHLPPVKCTFQKNCKQYVLSGKSREMNCYLPCRECYQVQLLCKKNMKISQKNNNIACEVWENMDIGWMELCVPGGRTGGEKWIYSGEDIALEYFMQEVLHEQFCKPVSLIFLIQFK